MAKLVLSLNGAVQGEFSLSKERISIGRKPDNDIQVDNLAVSGKHALVITILDDSFLEDLGSTNGTYVNGKLIKKHALRDGDVVGIGKHELKYVNEHATADDEDFEKVRLESTKTIELIQFIVVQPLISCGSFKPGHWSFFNSLFLFFPDLT